MRQTKLFTKTSKDAPKDEISLNAKLLIRAGYIDKLMSGVYTFLPLGWIVLKKIEDIIREEMNKINGQEIHMPSLCPEENWKRTGRLDSMDVLFKAQGGNEISRSIHSSSYILNPTHEEVVTPIVKKFASSYRDLPVAVYQFQNKFRNEPRAKSGLLRGREFRMKDLYSFHKDEKCLNEYYEKSKIAYKNVFNRLGIGEDTYIALASGGDFIKDYSHEFQTKSEFGEDLCFYASDADICFNKEVVPSIAPVVDDTNVEQLELEKIETKGMTSVKQVIEFLKLDIKNTAKTLFYECDGEVIVVAVRSDYDIDERKLRDVLSCEQLQLASVEKIKELTGAEVGYAGLINLPVEMRVFVDNTLQNRKNLEMGANETDFHYINVNFGRDINQPEEFFDIKVTKKGDCYPETGEVYDVFNAVEVGNIFPLNTKFSEAFDYNYIDENGQKKIVYMGCYGIGPTRLMGVIAEKFADENGLVWPAQISPFRVHLIDINQKEDSDKVYKLLQENGIEVLYDDRDSVSAGNKFADSDLIGCAIRVVASKRTMENNSVEIKKRTEEVGKLIGINKLIDFVNTDCR